MNEEILNLNKQSGKTGQAAEKISFLIVGITLFLTVYDGFTNLIAKSVLDKLYLSISAITGILNILFAVIINKIKPESKKIIIYRLLIAVSGIILILDGVNKIYQHYHAMQFLLMFAGFLYLSHALFYENLQKLHYIKFNDKRIIYRTFLISKSFLWNDLSSTYLDKEKLIISLNNGKVYNYNIFPKDSKLFEDFILRFTETAKSKIKFQYD
jgi:hypothetical protein